MVVAFGGGTIEFFKNTGNPTGSPLSRVPGATINIGIYGGYLPESPVYNVREVGDTVYFVGYGSKGSLGVFRLNGMQAEKISNPSIDALLQGSYNISILGTAVFDGMLNVIVEIDSYGSSLAALCFCVDTNQWWILKTPANGGATLRLFESNLGTSYCVLTNPSIDVYKMSPDTWTDDSIAYTLSFKTAPLQEENTNRKFVNRLRVIGDTQSSPSNLAVSYSDDDQVTYSTARNIDLSAQNKELTRLGSHMYGRSWKFEHSANTDCRLQAFELTRSMGTS
jgi:hypothetical protein